MKRTIFILAILLATLFLIVQAESVVFISGTSAGGVSYLYQDTFNGTGSDLAWTTVGGTPDYDYATSPAPFEGDESLQLVSGDQIYIDITAASEIYVAYIFHREAETVSENMIFLRNGASNLVYINPRSGGLSRGYNVGGSRVDSSVGPQGGTTYYVQIRAKKGTGSNAELEWWLDTNGDFDAGSRVGQSSDGTWTSDITRIQLNSDADSYLFDDLRVDNAKITY